MRDERFSTPKEIGRNFKTKEESSKAGVIVATKGKKVAYTDTSESHILVTGGTGTGKTQCCVKDYVAEVIDKGESALVLDIKLIWQILINRLLNTIRFCKFTKIILQEIWKEPIKQPRLCTIFLMLFAKTLNQKSSIGVIPGRNFWMAVFIALWILQPTKTKLILPRFKVLLSRAKKNTAH